MYITYIYIYDTCVYMLRESLQLQCRQVSRMAQDLTWFPVLHPEDQIRDGKWIYQPEIHDGTTLRMDK